MVLTMTETWTASTVDRTQSPNVAPERTAAEALLDYFRETLLCKCAGLSGAAQAAVRPAGSRDLITCPLRAHLCRARTAPPGSRQ